MRTKKFLFATTFMMVNTSCTEYADEAVWYVGQASSRSRQRLQAT